MKKTKYLILLPILFLFFSCRKKGCTDPDANNYSSKAKKDNCGCLYQGALGFWFNEETSNSIKSVGSAKNYVEVFIDGKLWGIIKLNKFYSKIPLAESSQLWRNGYELGKNKKSTSFYQIIKPSFLGEEEFLISEGDFEWTAGLDLLIEIKL